MGEFDRLPAPLRCWLARAVLPWSVTSALTVWNTAQGDPSTALRLLNQLENQRITRDAARIRGPSHPAATGR